MNTTFDNCPCGRVHVCNTKHIVIRENAVEELLKLCKKYSGIHLISDENTFAAGKVAFPYIKDKTVSQTRFSAELLVPDEKAVNRVFNEMSEKTDLIVGIGSGVIQDICKYTADKRKLPYFIVATAPSMDGYASSGAAMIMGGMKITYPANVAAAIIGDVNILKNAPTDMIKAGFGDIIGKFSCLNDWKLSALVNGEYFCKNIYDMVYGMLEKTRNLGSKLLERDPEAIKTLMEALVGIGVAMAYSGNTRPGSGSEHHLSHFFEITGIIDSVPYFIHGIDVAYSTVKTAELRREIISNYRFEPKEFNRADWEQNIRRIYGRLSDSIIDFQNRLGWHETDKSELYIKNREKIIEILSEVPSPEEITEILASVGLDTGEFEKMYGAEKISDAVHYGMDLKDRYTVLWLYNTMK